MDNIIITAHLKNYNVNVGQRHIDNANHYSSTFKNLEAL